MRSTFLFWHVTQYYYSVHLLFIRYGLHCLWPVSGFRRQHGLWWTSELRIFFSPFSLQSPRNGEDLSDVEMPDTVDRHPSQQLPTNNHHHHHHQRESSPRPRSTSPRSGSPDLDKDLHGGQLKIKVSLLGCIGGGLLPACAASWARTRFNLQISPNTYVSTAVIHCGKKDCFALTLNIW